jgi:hypothetical protein
MLAALLRITALYALFFALLAAAGLALGAQKHGSKPGTLDGGYIDSVLPAIRQDLDSYRAAWLDARAAAANRTAAASVLSALARHTQSIGDQLSALQPPTLFAQAHQQLIGLYTDMAAAAQLGSDCIEHPSLECQDLQGRLEALRARAQDALYDLLDAAAQVASLAG